MMTFRNPDFEALAQKEWLLTNGLGGYASSTICGANTRRYHGLLVASFNPPTDRRVLVSRVAETAVINGSTPISLDSNQYPGTVHPQGYQYLRSFARKPLPTVHFDWEAGQLAKTIFMVQGENSTIVEYRNEGASPIQLKLRPQFVYRDFHSLFHEAPHFDFYVESIGHSRLKIHAQYGAPPVFFSFSNGTFLEDRAWYRQVEYAKEQYRGLDFSEDTYSIGYVAYELLPGECLYLLFTTEENRLAEHAPVLKSAELKRLEALAAQKRDAFEADLLISGDQFIVQRSSTGQQTLLAGYHWFADWGRDTMIAMRGLTIAQNQRETSESIIRTFLQVLDQGMLPNRFPDQGENPEYNTIDATLWLFVVLFEYHQQFHNPGFIEEVYPFLLDILEAHRKGTRYGIHLAEEGLLYGGEEGVQLTWMDARVGGYVVTPRQGCPVEINALWYNALCITAFFGKQLGKKVSDLEQEAKKLAKTFRDQFVNQRGYLYDVVIPGSYKDDSLRPNQIYAISLPFSPLTQKEAKSVLAAVEEHLYTDLGLRSLSPQDEAFRPMYGGDPWQRDTAYHQGTVWTFLWGEYALAFLKLNKYSEKAKTQIHRRMEALRDHFYQRDCLQGISEIFDGEQPMEGRGCIQQAWSVGMVLKVFDAMNKN